MYTAPYAPSAFHEQCCQGTTIFHFDLATGDAGAEDEPQGHTAFEHLQIQVGIAAINHPSWG